MKTALFTILILAFTYGINAQQVSLQVISSTGGTTTQGNNQISYTLAQPITQTVSGGTSVITQGFQQTNLQVTLIIEHGLEEVKLDVYPNPTSDFLNIEFQNIENSEVKILLYDEAGKVILSQDMPISTREKIQYDLTDYVPGVYFLQLSF